MKQSAIWRAAVLQYVRQMRAAWVRGAMVIVSIGLLSGCANDPKNPDPYEKSNRAMYRFNEKLDKAVLKPVSDAYKKIVPRPVRTGVGNALDNLGYLNVILNDFLQGQWRQGWSDTGRFAANTTVGVLGVFDVASGWGLAEHRNDFGITLGKWGSGPGPYLVLPVLGPSSGRDVGNVPVAMVTNPMFWIEAPLAVTLPMNAASVAEGRARADAQIEFRDKAALDPYVFMRDAYLRHRWSRIHGGQPPVDEGFYEENGEEKQLAPAAPPNDQPIQPVPQPPREPATQPTTRPKDVVAQGEGSTRDE